MNITRIINDCKEKHASEIKINDAGEMSSRTSFYSSKRDLSSKMSIVRTNCKLVCKMYLMNN